MPALLNILFNSVTVEQVPVHETVPSKYAIVIYNLNNEDNNGKVIRIRMYKEVDH